MSKFKIFVISYFRPNEYIIYIHQNQKKKICMKELITAFLEHEVGLQLSQ